MPAGKERTFRSLLPGRSKRVTARRKQGGRTYTYKASHSEDDWSDYSDTDVEKQSFLSYHDGSSTSGSSSRSSSGSHKPMLKSRRRTEASAYKFNDSYAKRRRCTRLFGVAVGATLVIFVLHLVIASRSSSSRVELGFDRPDPVAPTWEQFPFLKRYHGGIRNLISREKNVPEYPNEELDVAMIGEGAKTEENDKREEQNWTIPASEIFNPYPLFDNRAYLDEYGPSQECFLDKHMSVRIPQLHSYPGVVEGMPDNVMGSYDVLGLRDDICFERFGRLGPYGMGYSKKKGGVGAGMEGDREGAESVWDDVPQINFKGVDWAAAQKQCAEANAQRFRSSPSTDDSDSKNDKPKHNGRQLKTDHKAAKTEHGSDTTSSSKTAKTKGIPRNALLIRTWGDYQYRDEDILYLRALVAELSILSRAEYQVHLLVHIRDEKKGIWADEEAYEEVLSQVVPAEFRGMATLWSENQMRLVYPGLEESNFRNLAVHGSYRGSFLPVQHFAHKHPEFDFIWNWELDARYTGHFYHLLNQISEWATEQPRKLLWERSSRFYVPSVHGSWDDFSHMVRVQTEHGTASKNNIWLSTPADGLSDPASWQEARPEQPIWGPLVPESDDPVTLKNDPNPEPPTSFSADDYEWGVGEPADLISLNPLFDPDGTDWLLADDVTGYNKSTGLPPRRASIVAASRLSRRLLSRMHRETSRAHRLMFTEMWPASIALHHGLKAVYAPHPVFIDRRWPTDYLAAIFNGGRNGATGGGRLSVFSEERQHNFKGTTWYYNAGFAPNLWRRWLGYKVDNDGGERWEVQNEGRMCLPAMLLHPVKDVHLIVSYEDDAKEGEGDEE